MSILPRTTFSCWFLGAAVHFSAVVAVQAQPSGIELRGTLVDVTCFARARAAHALGHTAATCTRASATDPVGILVVRDGSTTFYVLATPPDALSAHVGSEARLHGERSPRGNIVKPTSLQVRDAGGWRDLALLPDM